MTNRWLANRLRRVIPLACLPVVAAVWFSGCNGTDPSGARPPAVFSPNGAVTMKTGISMTLWFQRGSRWEEAVRGTGDRCRAGPGDVVEVPQSCNITGVHAGTTTVQVRNAGGGRGTLSVTVDSTPVNRVRYNSSGYTFDVVFAPPDGIYLIYNDTEQSFLYRRDLTTGVTRSLAVVGAAFAGALAIDTAQSRLYFAAGGRVIVLDIATDTPVDTILGVTGNIYNAVLSPDGKHLFLGTFDGVFSVDLTAGEVDHKYRAPGAVNHVALSPDNQRLYASLFDRSDGSKGQLLELDATTLTYQRRIIRLYVQGLAVSSDGSTLFVIGGNNTGVLSCSLGDPPHCDSSGFNLSAGYDLKMSSDGQYLYTTGAYGVTQYSTSPLQQVRTYFPAPGWRIALDERRSRFWVTWADAVLEFP